MDETFQAGDWRAALSETYYGFIQQIISHSPQLLSAFALLIIGLTIAWILKLVSKRLVEGLEGFYLQAAQRRRIKSALVRSYARLASNIVFWVVLVFFVAASANLLNWGFFTGVTVSILAYLPNAISGLIIIGIGVVFSGFAHSAVKSAAEKADIAQAELLSRIAQIAIILASTAIGAEQFGINLAFLTTLTIVVLGILLAGFSLAFGLGAKIHIANAIGASAAGKHYQIGQMISFANIEGQLLEITTTSLILDTDKGIALVPARLFQERISLNRLENTDPSTTPEGSPLAHSSALNE